MLKLYKAFALLFPFIPTVIGNFTNAFQPKVDYLPPGTYTAYVKGPFCTPSAPIQYPKSVTDVVAIVEEAIENNTTVKAFGHRHSITDIICTDGIPVDMRGIQGYKLNADLSATVGAGMSLRDFTTRLRQDKRALRTIPVFGNLTIGGTIGTGAHGSTIKYNSSISSQVIALTMVDGTGNIRYINSTEELKAFRIHLGLLGIILDVTFYTVPLYKTLAHCYSVSHEIMFNRGVVDIARNTDQVFVHWYPRLKKAVICNWTNVDEETPGNAITAALNPPTSSTFNQYVIPAFEIYQTLCSVEAMQSFEPITMATLLEPVPDFPPIFSQDGKFEMPAVGYYDEMLTTICNDSGNGSQCVWNHGANGIDILDNEIVVPLDRIGEYARAVEDILSKYQAAFPFDGIVLRFSGETDIYMSNSFGQEVCHFEFFTIKRKNPYDDPSTGLAAYQAIVQLMANNFNGKCHWGKCGLHYISQERITKKLSSAQRDGFVAIMNKYDPNGIFLNSFGRRLKDKSATKIDIDPTVKHCALLDNCICEKSSDCANEQFCTRIEGYPNFPVCMFGPSHSCYSKCSYPKTY